MNVFKKIINIPSGSLSEAECIDTWVVTWLKRVGEFSTDIEKCYQAFTNKQDAERFKESIITAHKLIGNTHGTQTEMHKQKAGL